MLAITDGHSQDAVKNLGRYLAAHQRRRLAELADRDPERVAVNRFHRVQPIDHAVALGGDQALGQRGSEKWECYRFSHRCSFCWYQSSCRAVSKPIDA